MIVMCPSCEGRFQYDESRFGVALVKRLECPACGRVFEVAKPQAPSELSLTPPPEEELPSAPEAVAPMPGARVREMAQAAPGARFSLAFLTGPQAGAVRALTRSRTVIGREEGDLPTHDPETSRRHALLEIREDGSLWLEDLGSTNGTLVDGEALAAPRQLDSRQEFSCGNSTFMVLIGDTPLEAAP
jgi:hypothetical protein